MAVVPSLGITHYIMVTVVPSVCTSTHYIPPCLVMNTPHAQHFTTLHHTITSSVSWASGSLSHT